MKMMKFFLLAAAAVAAISCVKENLPVENENPTPEVELVPMTFTASHETAETKVAYEDGVTAWKVGDMIKVIAADGTATDFEAIEVTNEGKTATFEGLTVENANEYYAVYPASAYKGTPAYVTDAAGGKLVVEVPHIQQAVAGTFHESAILCIANTKGNVFNFKHSCAFLKFNIADPEGVKSVRLKVNGSTNVAGIGYVGVNATDINPKYASSDANMSAYDMITLNAPEGGFEAGKDYFIAMRANSCPNGITAYIEYSDNVKVRTSSSKVFTDGSIGKIRNLGQLDKSLAELTPYDAYTLGFDIMVAGKAINKATYGEATCVSEESTNKSITSAGIYFIDSNATNVDISGAFTKNALVIGNDMTCRSNISVNNTIKWNANTIAFYNLNFIDNTDNSLFQANAAGGTLLFDNCSLTTDDNKSQLIYSSADMEKIAFYNCDINVLANNKYIANISNKTLSNFDFVNNIVYSAAGTIRYQFKFIVGNTTVTNFNLSNNTIASVFPYTYGKVAENYTKISKLDNLVCKNNLFYVAKYSDSINAAILSASPSTMTVSNNHMYKEESDTDKLKVVGDIYVSATTNEASLIKSKDLANGIIVPATTAGATR